MCPNCKTKLTNGSEYVTFQDIDGNCTTFLLVAKWCVECNYQGEVY